MERSPAEYLGEKVKYDDHGQLIWAVDKDGGLQRVADLRGWGAIQNLFKKKDGFIDEDAAAKYQDSIGAWIVDAINEKLERERKQDQQEKQPAIEKLKELTGNDLKGYTKMYLTVGRLRSFLKENDYPDHALVVIQRIQDVYYQKHGWGVYLKRGDFTYQAERMNQDIKSGKYLDKNKYPKMKPENLIPISEEEIKATMDQYHPAFCCVFHKDDPNVMFINLHY
jgi:hypothetical protein